MSLYDYEVSKKIEQEDYPFYALVMAAMRRADTSNLLLLKRAFPLVWSELQARYDAPGGLLVNEREAVTGLLEEAEKVGTRVEGSFLDMDVENARIYMAENKLNLDEFIERLKSEDPSDYRKYWGWATPEQYRKALS